MRKHNLDEGDEAILRRWKGNGLKVYTEHVQDDDYVCVFNAGDFMLHVESGMYGVPIFSDDDRALLNLALDEIERVPQVVSR